MLLGSAEIRVPEKAGKTYAAPNLIYHYMKDRGYLPPQEFLRCLGFNGQRITSIEHPREMCEPRTCQFKFSGPAESGGSYITIAFRRM